MITTHLVDIFLLGISIAGLSMFFQICMTEGYIFEFWLTFLQDTLYYKKDKNTNQLIVRESIVSKSLYKILGGCVYCNSFYTALVFFILVNPAPITYFLPYIGIMELTILLSNHYMSERSYGN